MPQSGAGEATETQKEADEARVPQQGALGAAKERIRALIALGILEAVEACGCASEIADRLDGAYIHDDCDEETLVLVSWRIAGDSDEG